MICHQQFRFVFSIVVVVLSAQSALAADTFYVYPQPFILLEASELAVPGTAADFVILDARKKVKYERSHIPNAIWIVVATWKKSFGNGDGKNAWGERIGSLGIGQKSNVVVYDDGGGTDAARMWWTLRYWGVKRARLLNGGWDRWKAGGYATEAGPSKMPEKQNFTAMPIRQSFADKNDVLKTLTSKSWQIVDTRSEGEFCGTAKLSNKRGGAIPGAIHLEWVDLIEPATKRFKSPDELTQLFAQAGIDLKKPVATHCQSGGRASVMVFAMELMGAKGVRNYYAGWSDWGNDDTTPVEVTQPKSDGQSN